MNDVKVPEAKMLRGLSPEHKLEIAVRALCDTAKEMSLNQVRLTELVDRLETITKRVESQSWTRAIKEDLDRRKTTEDGSRKSFTGRKT